MRITDVQEDNRFYVQIDAYHGLWVYLDPRVAAAIIANPS